EAAGHIEILKRLTGRALHEVVETGDNHEPPGSRVEAPADVAEIGPGDVLDLRQRVPGQPHEWLLAVRRLEHFLDPLGRRPGSHLRVNRLEDSAIERHQMGNEGHLRAKLLLHLGDMTMSEYSVGGHRSVVL